jgi:hypothetical protein
MEKVFNVPGLVDSRVSDVMIASAIADYRNVVSLPTSTQT